MYVTKNIASYACNKEQSSGSDFGGSSSSSNYEVIEDWKQACP